MPDQKPLPDYLVAPWKTAPPAHTIATIGTLWGFLQTCPHAQTLEAYSSQFACTVWIALPCRQWSCRHCAQVKIKKLAVKTEQAKPNRFLTLTVDPALYQNPRHAFDETRRKVPECMRTLRNKFAPLDYLRVTELTRRGWPHYHLLVRSPYIPHEVVKRRWNDLTGAQIVDLRQIKDTLNTYTYLVKYLSKMHKIGWTERHVSYSRSFFPPPETPAVEGLDLSDQAIIEAHPSTYLYSRFRGAKLVALGINLYAIDPQPHVVESVTSPDDWTQCAEEPNRDDLFPQGQEPGETIQPMLFPKGQQIGAP